MKQIQAYKTAVYHYVSREEREDHVVRMELDRWKVYGPVKELKEGINILAAQETDYQWCAYFRRETLKEK